MCVVFCGGVTFRFKGILFLKIVLNRTILGRQYYTINLSANKSILFFFKELEKKKQVP